MTLGKSLNLSEVRVPAGIPGLIIMAPLRGKVQCHHTATAWAQACPWPCPLWAFVKGEVGFSHLDRSPEDFHGACHLGNPGDQVSGLPPFRLPSRCSGLLQPDVCLPPLLLYAGGRGVPTLKGPQPFSMLLPKHWLGTKVGRPSWTPF